MLPGAVMPAVRGAGHDLVGDRPALHDRAVTSFLLGEPLPLPPHRSAAPSWSRPADRLMT
ncbi:hypothetical protein SAMN05660976_04639 [Nonomuraea pusilla]|uniref:Uncharacterized protein n=1 Tax=Nonomuraea pusilla TaxID=46177 RepID=A0A1H7WWB5_9ACTN|nr:hypothetical protein SAMN05660976_04639 [Nonomuraea pusilla]